MAEQLVIPNVYGVVRLQSNRDTVLLQERWKPDSDPQNSGKLELPGGKWRAFESASQCLRREVEEESGIVGLVIDQEAKRVGAAGSDVVETVVPALFCQMLEGPYPSVITVLTGSGRGTPVSRGDGSRNALWWTRSEVKAALRDRRDTFTALTLGVLLHLGWDR